MRDPVEASPPYIHLGYLIPRIAKIVRIPGGESIIRHVSQDGAGRRKVVDDDEDENADTIHGQRPGDKTKMKTWNYVVQLKICKLS